MSDILLSVMIPTTPDRKSDFDMLKQEFERQIEVYELKELVELFWDDTGKEMSIGTKRNLMYQIAKGEYSVQWDSDDWISEDGLYQMVQALKTNPDCCTYLENCDINGVEFISRFSLDYPDWEGDGNTVLSDGFHYHRTPFFKTPIRTDLCCAVGVQDCRFGEDHIFSRAIRPLLQIEKHIPDYIYHYIHNSKPEDHNERYGLDK